MDYSPIWISVKTAALTIVIVFFIGLAAAKLVAGLRNEKLKMVLDGIFTLPLVLPPTVAGFFLLYLFGIRRPIGAARGALEQVDENLIFAARTLGFSEWRIFWKVMFPAALPGIAGGGILAFARGLGEFGATAMIAGNIAGKTRTLPLAVYSAVAAGDMDTAYKYVMIIVLVSFLVVVLMNYFTAKERTYGKRGKKA